MSRTLSSVAWLNSKYSRVKGQIARTTERIKYAEARRDLHRHHVQRCEAQLVELKDALAEVEARALQLTRALMLHSHSPQIEAVGKTLPDEHPRFFKHGGMTTAIFRAFRSAADGVVTIDELHSELMLKLELAPEDSARFRMRLQTRLQFLLRQGKVTSPDRKGVPGRRWMLSKIWVPAPSTTQGKTYSAHRSKGSVQSARWLIQSQLDIAVAKSGAVIRGDADLSSKLSEDMEVIDTVWRHHPLHFEVDLGWHPSSRASHYRESIYARVSRILAQTRHGMTLLALQAACPCPSNKRRQASIRAIEAALKQLLLEGRAEHRWSETDCQVVWLLRSQVDESISTSVR